MPRSTLAAIIAAVLLIAISPAQAKPKHTRHQATAAQPRAFVDVAAIPAYGTAEVAPTVSRRAHPMGRKHIAPSRGPFIASGGGIVRSAKTGATARVSPKYAALFQAYINDLESQGAVVYYMGGYRRGPCANYSLHPCGMALDVCQDRRDKVSGLRNCHLPSRSQLARTAASHGLFEGGQWCHGDMGHVQVGTTASACGRNLYAAVGEFQAKSR